ncbi:hypothetical protein F0U61_47685 [Archangium violaceum]|uniref:hypothetical protein n=1 Tax=Archangium violaceum TaxID=83451 RepID=UPI002B28B82B|nr:hypothetical protein F0U61_47685 [Archangium violaceum]
MKNAQDLAPAVVYEDVPYWPLLIFFDLVLLAYLAAGFIWDFGLELLDVIAWSILATTLALAIVGWRRIEAGPSDIRVIRRGRLVLDRPLTEFSHIQPCLPGVVAFIVLRGGTRIWVPVMQYGVGECTQLLEYLASLTRKPGLRSTHGRRERPDELEVLVTKVDLGTEFCVGCGMDSDGPIEIDARCGVDLLLVGWSMERSVMLSGCASCRRKLRLLSFTLYVLTWVTFGLGLLGPAEVGGVDVWPLRSAMMILSIGALFYQHNWGSQFVDDRVLGIFARSLSADGTRVVLRVRKPGLLRELERRLSSS